MGQNSRSWIRSASGIILVLAAFGLAGLPALEGAAYPANRHDLVSTALARSWDEGVPLGNGLLGALVWQKGSSLRLSLDRADLWDLRPVKEFSSSLFRFSYIRKQVLAKDYEPVHQMGDVPYDRDPAPTKIPAGALEFDIASLGEVESVRLVLRDAVCEVRWKNGARLTAYVHAVEPVGWFKFEGVPESLAPRLVPPADAPAATAETARQAAGSKTLAGLEYPAPELVEDKTSIRYHQNGWGGMSYDLVVEWTKPDAGSLSGVWSVSARVPGRDGGGDAAASVAAARKRLAALDLESHKTWWKKFWAQSTVELPDPVLEKQWYLETYKFGAASRRGAPPITLQAVWTADDGNLPPWKGDYHNDLNTQLSYWPCYSGNHLEEGLAFLDWLWENRTASKRYTKLFFGAEGLNVPGVCTLVGEPMGGWAQYSLGPTVSAWLAQHFYLHWQFSRDRKFLEDRAYPWLKDAALFIDAIASRGEDGKKRLPLSSSPEINDNRIDAWFLATTNFDLALIRWLYGAAAELAGELNLKKERTRWLGILADWPELARASEDGRLLVAPGYPLKESHRHFSHLMAIHPLGIVDWSNGENDRRTVRASLAELDRLGPDWWCGYSYSWLGSLAARAMDGDKAAKALKIFAQCFCLPNSFHANGDQTKTGKSKLTYRPFTLEGNFAFAAAVQEMLLQSHTGIVRIFPAVPAAWRDVAFDLLRTNGAFLISATKQAGGVTEVRVISEKGGIMRLENPFGAGILPAVKGIPKSQVKSAGNILEIDMNPGEFVLLKAK
ncbi:MAG: glycosyl hydrolase family 95 catalytic domain-containing protein [Candidatus Aminicenantales bacterium]